MHQKTTTGVSRRDFLALAATLAASWRPGGAAPAAADLAAFPGGKSIRDWLGTTLVDGKYFLTSRPNLLEGAEQMLRMGTRVGKFWFEPRRAARDNPWNSRWPEMRTLVDLASSEYWQQVFQLPFSTLMLNTHSPAETGWNAGLGAAQYQQISNEWEDLVRYLYAVHGHRPLTIILQNWEGDWQVRGIGESWDPPPPDWAARCARYRRRLEARQLGVSRARGQALSGTRLQVVHAVEVNRVVDGWSGVPTVTEHVLPEVDVDLVSYSCYDAMQDAATLTRAIATIRKFARTTGPFGPGAVYLGEIGIPENLYPDRIAERWRELLGVARATDMLWVSQWQLHCNELDARLAPHPAPPVFDPRRYRGFWLVRPDGSLSETGELFQSWWQGTTAF
jgi:hypothetical protein